VRNGGGNPPGAAGRRRPSLSRPYRLRFRIDERAGGPDRANGELLAVLDLDSPKLARFDAEDEVGIVRLAEILTKAI
jgi:hypothetical protein